MFLTGAIISNSRIMLGKAQKPVPDTPSWDIELIPRPTLLHHETCAMINDAPKLSSPSRRFRFFFKSANLDTGKGRFLEGGDDGFLRSRLDQC